MRRLLNWLSRKRFPYEPLIAVSISRERLLHNLQEFRKLIPHGYVAPVLKSNAYGHGLFEVADILRHDKRIPFIAVDSYFEAVALRARGIKTPLLIIGYTRPRTIMESSIKRTSFTITNIDTLRAIKNIASVVHVHIKIDTGMHRQGILMDEVRYAIELLEKNPCIRLEGICTHFSDADNADESFTEAQVVHWNDVVAEFKTAFPNIWYIHAAATDGSRFSDDIRGNVIRLGIGLYGLSENPVLNKKLDLRPVLKMTTIITGLKTLLPGETVGYGNTFKADREMCIATIPVGYYEGLDRRLSNKGAVQVIIQNHAKLDASGGSEVICPIIGRVSMNITTIDASTVPGVCGLKLGMSVTVVSDSKDDPNSILAHAKNCGTIAYEIAVKIPQQLKRVIVK